MGVRTAHCSALPRDQDGGNISLPWCTALAPTSERQTGSLCFTYRGSALEVAECHLCTKSLPGLSAWAVLLPLPFRPTRPAKQLLMWNGGARVSAKEEADNASVIVLGAETLSLAKMQN